MERNNQKKHFVLIHGACHGAWCWYKLETLLTSAGHSVTSLDLAASGINPKQVEDLHSIADYYEPLMAFMASLPQDEKVILVGHSYNGLSISVAMEKFPEKISVAVFISAIMPSPTNSVVKIEEEYERKAKAGIQRTFLFEILPNMEQLEKQYEKSPPEDLALATKLVRPIGFFGNQDMLKETAVSDRKYGSVSRVFILCDEEDDIKESLKGMIAKYPPDEVKEIPGSDHMVMISKPQELCTYLQEIANRYS
ncbi:polyneuridine-aldehyde esterase-like isoform X2 [Telopea speciosissima]|uniref:polyneuridine-aldehyde esterase-like isoform X2 n=1 Tax=Telopea speciosissima TaxID=54955 RepID=UPI001CC6AA73|nr:polyneuridine-aldehyde esterase-like isoform X2 [Telopea speciosissima]